MRPNLTTGRPRDGLEDRWACANYTDGETFAWVIDGRIGLETPYGGPIVAWAELVNQTIRDGQAAAGPRSGPTPWPASPTHAPRAASADAPQS